MYTLDPPNPSVHQYGCIFLNECVRHVKGLGCGTCSVALIAAAFFLAPRKPVTYRSSLVAANSTSLAETFSRNGSGLSVSVTSVSSASTDV